MKCKTCNANKINYLDNYIIQCNNPLCNQIYMKCWNCDKINLYNYAIADSNLTLKCSCDHTLTCVVNIKKLKIVKSYIYSYHVKYNNNVGLYFPNYNNMYMYFNVNNPNCDKWSKNYFSCTINPVTSKNIKKYMDRFCNYVLLS